MGAVEDSPRVPRAGVARAATEASGKLPFAAAIGLSAFLLFSIQLRAGRLVLPVFGGAPAVWATALCFFTALLFLGYLYAHFAATRLSPRMSGAAQLGLAVAALGAVVLAPSDLAGLRSDGLPDVLNVLLVLAVVAGAPAFLLGTTTPLVSSWYAGRGHDPWWLFAVSNASSFGALLVYPFVLAPLVGLSAQRGLLAAGMAAYGLMLALVVRGAPQGSAPAMAAEENSASTPGVRRQIVWLLAAFVPAGLLSATTNFLQTDLTSAPLIWVGPLGMYLASFVAAFSTRGRGIVQACKWLAPVAAAVLWVPYVRSEAWPASALLLVELGVFFVFATAIHGRLAESRPQPEQLTRFYLAITAGGALGTAFVALVAPVVFSAVYEYPALIVAGLAVLIVMPSEDDPLRSRVVLREAGLAMFRLAAFLAAAVVLYAMVTAEGSGDSGELLAILMVSAIVPAVAFDRRATAVVGAVVLVGLVATHEHDSVARTRNFYGVIEVRELPGVHLLYHGTTLHGLQYQDDERRKEPTSYYAKAGPLGAVFEDLRARGERAAIGAVGLGVGTVAAYARAEDDLTFFEINPAVVDLARDARYFSYLTDAPVDARVVLGDGRLSLDRQPDGSFDLLVLDAFSSDAVPVHLLTKEAMRTYVRKLRPQGVAALHLSNRYYDLVTPVAATARSLGLGVALFDFRDVPPEASRYGANASTWVVVGEPAAVERFLARGWEPVTHGGRALTDDYSDLTRWLDLGAW